MRDTTQSTKMKAYESSILGESTESAPFPKELKEHNCSKMGQPGSVNYPDTLKATESRQTSAVDSLKKRADPSSKLYP